jgi:2-C-methyl-D-erythritol 4-phosphate cytidylyltransferase
VKYEVIIAAGGTGKRMSNALPKQFIDINGKPIIIYTIEAFLQALPDCRIILALHPDWINYWNTLKEIWLKATDICISEGGAERFHSVQQALTKVQPNSIVLIHDAARPMVSKELILRVVQACETKAAVVPVIPIVESMRRIIADENVVVNRNEYVLIQTPQCFKSELLQSAYSQEYKPEFTDDASVVESTGTKIHLIAGERKNIKITTSEDLQIASLWLTH